MKPAYDLIVYGATGFTGKLVAEYLLRRYGVGTGLRWAIAGRSAGKLDALRRSLGDAATELQTLTADSSDKKSLAELARQTRVVVTTVGPYALYGSALVAACVDAGTHYCDLAGEPQWIRRMIDRHHDAAVDSGAKIVHCCGFDSVPMDIGVWFLQREARERHGRYCEHIRTYVKALKGTASGGTLASMMNLIREARSDRETAGILMHPYSLNPPGQRDGPDGRDQRKAEYRDDAGAWTAPFVMAAINTRVVRRSHALLDYRWGRDFRYNEAVLTGQGVSGWLRSKSLSATLKLLILGASTTPTRRFLQRFVVASPGEGPNRTERKTGFFNLRQIGFLPDGERIEARITGDEDPGYGSTSKMLGECAVCLAKDALDERGGVLTPAAAMAQALLLRLQKNAGLSFEISG